MHNLSDLSTRVRSTPLRLACLALLALVLAGCGFTDDVGTNYKIVMVSETYPEDETLAPIGLLQVNELVHVTFQVTPKDGDPVVRTRYADFELVNEEAGDDKDAFVFTPSPNLNSQPYHTLISAVLDAEATLCSTYDGPETLDGPVEDCMRLIVQEKIE